MKTFLDLIKGVESKNNYNIMAKDKAGTNRRLTNKTINEVLLEQSLNNDRAAGAYQIKPKTLQDLKKMLKLSGNEKFDEEMQDKLATALLERRGLSKFLAGELSQEEFGNELAKEFAALPMLKATDNKKVGESYYEGQWGNRALISPAHMMSAMATLKPTQEEFRGPNYATQIRIEDTYKPRRSADFYADQRPPDPRMVQGTVQQSAQQDRPYTETSYWDRPPVITQQIEPTVDLQRQIVPEVFAFSQAGSGRGMLNPPFVVPQDTSRFMGEPTNIWRDSQGNPIRDSSGGYIYQKEY